MLNLQVSGIMWMLPLILWWQRMKPLSEFTSITVTKHTIFIQSASTKVQSVLQAEAMALLLAASAVKALGWSIVSFYSDCRTLVEVAEARNLLEKVGQWKSDRCLLIFSTLLLISTPVSIIFLDLKMLLPII